MECEENIFNLQLIVNDILLARSQIYFAWTQAIWCSD